MEQKEITFSTKGVCAKYIRIVLNSDNTIAEVEFYGGCNGNAKGIASLVRGMKAEDVIEKLRGTTCGFRPTSCPDQLAQALTENISAASE